MLIPAAPTRAPAPAGTAPAARRWSETNAPATSVAGREIGALRADLVEHLPLPVALRFARAKVPTVTYVWVAWGTENYSHLRQARVPVLSRDEWSVLVLGTSVDVASSRHLEAQVSIKARAPHVALTREWLCAGYAHTPVVIAYPSVNTVSRSWGLVLTGYGACVGPA